MQKVAIVGGGISGLTSAQLLNERYEVTVFEKELVPGGLIRCKRVNGSLYHICGGHVFNSKRQDVLDWFWSMFDMETEFLKADRNSVVFLDGGLHIPYPIENHIYLLDEHTQRAFIDDLLYMVRNEHVSSSNFEEFLIQRFGSTLYELYFKPYNEKIWRRSLKSVPLSWLEGKLPMPTVSDMIYNNINHIEEKSSVHSTFWYEKENGSQYLADKLARDIDVKYGKKICNIQYNGREWLVDGKAFDKIVFCGNIKDLPHILFGVDIQDFAEYIDGLEYHGTTSVFCEIEANPYSWIYLPSKSHESHRIICTGNFSLSNNTKDIMTGTIEFTDYISEGDIKENLKRIPLNPKYLAHHYNQYTYPIQDVYTREMIQALKRHLWDFNFYMTGRFADWEYYNMDLAIGAAMDTCSNIG